MNQRGICSYFIKQNVKYLLFCLACYLVVIEGMMALMGDGKSTPSYCISMIMIFMYSSNMKENILGRCSGFMASRKLIFRVQVMTDIVVAVVSSMVFTIIESFHVNFEIGYAVRYGLNCFTLILCLEAIISLDGFGRFMLFNGFFSGKKSRHPVIGLLSYMAIIVVVVIVYTGLEEQNSLLLCLVLYIVGLLVVIGCYLRARTLSTKKEF